MKAISKAVLLALSIAALPAHAVTADTHVVNAKLWNEGGKMGITTDVASVKAGKIAFDVTNGSKNLVHEMLVVKVDTFDDVLPYDAQEAKVYEDKVNDFGEVSELEPGQSGNLTVNLKPGNYLLLCNIPGHYKMKMYSKLVVVP